MNRSRIAVLRLLLVLSDGVCIIAAFVVASRLRFGTGWLAAWSALLPAYWLAVLLVVAGAIFGLWRQGMYELVTRWSLRDELASLLRTGAALVLLTLAALFAFGLGDVSRLFLSVFFPLAASGLIVARVCIRWVCRHANAQGRAQRHIVLVGSGPLAQGYLRQRLLGGGMGVRIAGYLGEQSDAMLVPHLGDIADLTRVLTTKVVDEVVVALPLLQSVEIEHVLKASQEQGKAVRIPLHLRVENLQRARLETVGGTPTLSITNSADHSLAKVGKRTLDIAVASLALVVAAPVLLAAMTAIALTDGFPVIFRQCRTGLHGRDFDALKLRTMCRDAEARLAQLAAHNERTGPVFKMTHDPRVTPIGRILRKTSIDELPQLFNVLRGDMSLVGPRPATLSEVERYDPWHRRRLSVKPGMTGLWQVSARNDPEFDNWVALDLAYIDTWSLTEDMRLLARTPVAMFRQSGT